MTHDLDDELKAGQKAARAVVDHMKIMGTSRAEWEVPDEDGVWVVKVEYRGKDKE